MKLSQVPVSVEINTSRLNSRINMMRNAILALLSAASISFAQEKPHTNNHAQGSIGQDINFMHSDDPTEGGLDHLIPNDHHIHTIAEMHYSHNHATQDGNLEIGELAGLGIHSQIPLRHTHDSSTLAKIGFHGLVSTNNTDPLRKEITFDAGIMHRVGKWKIGGGMNFLHEEAQITETHSETELHDDGHGHKKYVTHTETSTHPHEYTGIGFYIDIARQLEFFQKRVYLVCHAEHDESLTGSGNFVSTGIQANKIPILPDIFNHHLHGDFSCMAVFGDGERFNGRGPCLMPGITLHWLLNKDTTVFASWVRPIPSQKTTPSGETHHNAITFGISHTF